MKNKTTLASLDIPNSLKNTLMIYYKLLFVTIAVLHTAFGANIDNKKSKSYSLPNGRRSHNRVRALQRRQAETPPSLILPIRNALTHLAVEVQLGQPPQPYSLLLDSASAFTWIGGDKAYVKTASSRNIGVHMSIDLGNISLDGEQYLDIIRLENASVHQAIGVGLSNGLPHNVDGILGIGPTELSNGVLETQPEVLTVVDSLFLEKGLILQLGIYLENGQGHINFGLLDPRFTDSLKYFPVATTYPAKLYWSVEASMSTGDELILPHGPIVIDSSYPLITIDDKAFARLQHATGAIIDHSTGLLRLSPRQYRNMKSVSINIGGSKFELTPNACILPRKHNTVFGGKSGQIYLAFNKGLPYGLGFYAVLGIPFLERYYVAYDDFFKRVGISPTPYTMATIN